MKLLSFPQRQTQKQVIESIEALLADAKSGEITSFACVGIAADGLKFYQGGDGSWLTLFGALTAYQQTFLQANANEHAGGE